MDRDNLILPVIVILLLVILAVVAFSLSGNNTFGRGNISFQYPNSWAENHVVGNFDNSTVYSEVTFTANFADNTGQQQKAFIIIQMQERTEGLLNLPSTNSIVMNTTNSTVASVDVDNITATQLGNYGPTVAAKITIIQTNKYNIVISYVCPRFTVSQTEEAYNLILQTFNIS
ncbi:MAG: hypothetical protein FJ150_09325 [Euryarchaeota archaeon]|nr:hypothetical protein [Euryarchaeota archaeon]